MHRPKHVVEYILLRVFGFFFCILPHRVALSIGWGLAWFSHYVVRFRTATARARIRQVFGEDLSETKVRRAAWTAWRNLCFNVVELARMPMLTEERVRALYDDPDKAMRIVGARAEGEGAVLAVPHAGNWDLAGVSCHLLGIPIFFIARRQKNPLTDDYLNRMRGATGVETVLNDSGVLKSVIRNLKRGKVLAILPDVRAPTESLVVPYLGGEANIGAGMALFARQARVPIIPAVVHRVGWTRHTWKAFDPVIPDPNVPKDEDWLRMTREVMAHFNQAVRDAPEQYFWFNKRWVLDPLKS